MRERNLSQRIQKNSNIVKWSRVESKTSPGIPDLHGFFADPKDLLQWRRNGVFLRYFRHTGTGEDAAWDAAPEPMVIYQLGEDLAYF